MGWARGFKGSVKALKHGEVKEFSATLGVARHHAVERMVDEALALGGDGVVGNVTDPGSKGFVSPEERVATLEKDGADNEGVARDWSRPVWGTGRDGPCLTGLVWRGRPEQTCR